MNVQKNTLSLTPEYLKTSGVEGITNLSDYTIPLGRRFRSLKLWFLIRSEGLSGLRKLIRDVRLILNEYYLSQYLFLTEL